MQVCSRFQKNNHSQQNLTHFLSVANLSKSIIAARSKHSGYLRAFIVLNKVSFLKKRACFKFSATIPSVNLQRMCNYSAQVSVCKCEFDV